MTIKTRILPESNYKAIYFNDKTIRVALDPSKPITELKFPEFYDVKITSKCRGNCSYCYMDSTSSCDHYDNVPQKIKDYFGKMSENERPFQIALAGGECTEAPYFIETLKTFYDLGITPNYTTNGMFIDNDNSRDILIASYNYCGGVAISCHPHLQEYWDSAIKEYNYNGVKLNTHHIISDRHSIDDFINIYKDYYDYIDYFVLLPYSDQGRAKPKEIDWDYLAFTCPDENHKIAFGANFHSYLVDKTRNPGIFNVSIYDPHSMSKFLDLSDMKLYPSSFETDEWNVFME
jgi:organic radical activating enzyme